MSDAPYVIRSKVTGECFRWEANGEIFWTATPLIAAKYGSHLEASCAMVTLGLPSSAVEVAPYPMPDANQNMQARRTMNTL